MSTATYQLQALSRIGPLIERARAPLLATRPPCARQPHRPPRAGAGLRPVQRDRAAGRLRLGAAAAWLRARRGRPRGAHRRRRRVALRGHPHAASNACWTRPSRCRTAAPPCDQHPLAFAGFAFDPAHPDDVAWFGFPEALAIVPRAAGRPQRRAPLLHRQPPGRRRDRRRRQRSKTCAPTPNASSPAASDDARAHVAPARPRPGRPRLLERQRRRPDRPHRRTATPRRSCWPAASQVESRRPLRRARGARAPAAALPRLHRLRRARRRRRLLPRRDAGDARRAQRPPRCAPTASPARPPAAPRDAEDAALGAALLADDKERREHAIVTRSLRESLRAALPRHRRAGRRRSCAASPTSSTCTRRSRRRPTADRHVLELVERLHPTRRDRRPAARAPRSA